MEKQNYIINTPTCRHLVLAEQRDLRPGRRRRPSPGAMLPGSGRGGGTPRKPLEGGGLVRR